MSLQENLTCLLGLSLLIYIILIAPIQQKSKEIRYASTIHWIYRFLLSFFAWTASAPIRFLPFFENFCEARQLTSSSRKHLFTLELISSEIPRLFATLRLPAVHAKSLKTPIVAYLSVRLTHETFSSWLVAENVRSRIIEVLINNSKSWRRVHFYSTLFIQHDYGFWKI